MNGAPDVNTSNMTDSQFEAMRELVRHGRCGPWQTGLSPRTYSALKGRGLIRCTYTNGNANASRWELTDDGRQWANENI